MTSPLGKFTEGSRETSNLTWALATILHNHGVNINSADGAGEAVVEALDKYIRDLLVQLPEAALEELVRTPSSLSGAFEINLQISASIAAADLEPDETDYSTVRDFSWVIDETQLSPLGQLYYRRWRLNQG